MTEISSVTALPREPRLHVAVVGAFGVRDGQQKALRAVEEAKLQHIHAQEREEPCPMPLKNDTGFPR